MEKRNLLLTIAYDGRAYHGWQIQENALSVQEVFQGALRQVIGDDFDVKDAAVQIPAFTRTNTASA